MTPLLLLSLLQPALAGKIRNPTVVEDALAYADADRAKAITLLEQAADDAKKKELGVIALNAGEQRRLAGDIEQARGWFDKAGEADEGLEPAVALGKLLLDIDKGLDARELAALASTSEKALLPTQNADRYLLLALMAAKQDDAGKVKQFSKKALDAGKADTQVLQRIKERLRSLAGTPADEVSLAEDGNGTFLEKAQVALDKGDNDRASSWAQKALDEAEEGSDEATKATWMLKRATATVAVQPNKIAVLVPKTGKYEVVGRQIEEALLFGYKREGGKAELVFLDTGATPEGAVAALEKAVLELGVIAVAGPVLSTVVQEVTAAADGLQVPLLSLSQSNEIAGNPWIHQAVPSVGDQAGALAEHVVLKEERTRIAIFAPDTPAGHRAAELFKVEVLQRSGTIEAETYYDAKATALMPYAAKLGGKSGRGGELARLKAQAREAGHNPNTVVLPPRVNFDAIFIPDNARNVALAAAALAYEEFSVGQFRAKKGARTIMLIGLSGWNHRSLVTSGNEYVRNSRFTDIYQKQNNPDFARDYRAALSRDPSSLEAAVADAGRLLAQGTEAGATTRAEFAEALGEVEVLDTNTGTTGFDEEHRTTPKIEILTIGYNGIGPVE